MWQLAHWRLHDDRPRPLWAWAFLQILGRNADSVDELKIIIGTHWPLISLINEAKAYSRYSYARSGGERLPPLCVPTFIAVRVHA